MSIEQMADEFVALAAQIKAFKRDNTIRILLVEDSEMDVEMLRSNLASVTSATGRKYSIEVASCIEDARQKISERRHNLVVLDWHLGHAERSGLELARELHADGIQFPFVILTGRENDYAEAVGEDCMGWINKLTATATDIDAAILHAIKNWYSRRGFGI